MEVERRRCSWDSIVRTFNSCTASTPPRFDMLVNPPQYRCPGSPLKIHKKDTHGAFASADTSKSRSSDF